MALSVGDKLGPYEILSPLGEGGMGQVWKARDTRLNRLVAIKTSHKPFNERFEREAHAIAALNHPHICSLYDVGPDYLVMEYIEGTPIRGPLPIEEALQLGGQIAAALEAAHQKGIVHRDLKPANILLTKSGVKLLDFGLAKFAQAGKRMEDVTITASLSGAGEILGTLQYMAPEQLEGKDADERSDIFAFGLVLYEMLTGRRAFEASSHANLIAGIMKEQPPPIAAFAASPQNALDRTLKKCLVKDPTRRWQTATDLRDELMWIAESDPAIPRTVSRRGFIPWLACGAVAGAAGAGLAVWAWPGNNSTTSARTIRLRIPATEGAWPERVIARQSLAISPAGDRIAIIMSTERGAMVWVQYLRAFTSSPLLGTEGATSVFWSPDGQFIGFWAAGKLKKIPADGGTALPICELPEPWCATWNNGGLIVTASYLTPSPARIITVGSGAVKEWKPVLWPKFMPDGKHLLYVDADSKSGGWRAYAEEFSSGRRTELMPTDTYVIFAPDHAGSSQGYLLYCRAGTLLARRFDATRLTLSGEPVPVAQGLPFFRLTAWAAFDTSADGVLIYTAGWQRSQLTWLDRRGVETSTVSAPHEFRGDLRLSPDGTKLAASLLDSSKGSTDLWVFDLKKDTVEPVTFEPGMESAPVWSPDGTRLAYGSAQVGPPRLKVKTLYDRESGLDFPGGRFQLPNDWSSDGQWIFYQTSGGEIDSEIWIASAIDRKLVALLQKPSNGTLPTLSPNGEYMAFAANDAGHYEVYVQRFDGSGSPKLTGGRRRVSHDGGTSPRWRPDGKELFFESPNRQIVAVAVKPGINLEIGPPVVLFTLRASARTMSPVIGTTFDVRADGQRFLVPKGTLNSEPVYVVINWQHGLRV